MLFQSFFASAFLSPLMHLAPVASPVWPHQPQHGLSSFLWIFPTKPKHMRLKWDCSAKLKRLEAMNCNRNTSYLMLNIWYSVFKNLYCLFGSMDLSQLFILPTPNSSLLVVSIEKIVSAVFSPPTSPSQSNSLLPQVSFQDIYLKMIFFVPKNILLLTVVLHLLVLVMHTHFSVPMRYEKKWFVQPPCFVLNWMAVISPSLPFILPALSLTAVVAICLRHHK